MTQDEPERKAEPSVNFLRACAAWFRSEAAEQSEDKAHWARVYNAENCDKAANLLSTALVISQNYQSLMVTAERETGQARAEIEAIHAADGNTIVDLYKDVERLAAERDSARSSLARVVEALKKLCDEIEDDGQHGADHHEEHCSVCRALQKARSALHRSQGE